ncbi:MAG: preprotein translocase subunit SecA [Pseudomonadota bacterium]
MSDIRALIVGRKVCLNDGAYVERADAQVNAGEALLRVWLDRMRLSDKRQAVRFIAAVDRHEPALQGADDALLRRKLHDIARQMHKKGLSDALIAAAFAVVREAARRTLKMRHHAVQLLAGRALLRGCIAELATGEGKTLAATLAVCTAAATGAAVHVVTVNDYLATRDCLANAPLFALLGLSVGNVQQDMPIGQRQSEYRCDVVYVSNKELTFDYLKDRLALGRCTPAQQALRRLSSRAEPLSILRGLHVAIVDEVDSVLIDEARTPLIISETLPDDLPAEVYAQAIDLVQELSAPRHYSIGAQRALWLTPAGLACVRERSAAWGGVWNSPLWRQELAQKALSATQLFQRDQHYIVSENKVQIVDEFTGRVMPDRTWERGLHQMIEAKENCAITGQRKTLAQITYQRFFGRYVLLAGMTGTAQEVAAELKHVYDLSTVSIPTHRPSRRLRFADRVLPSAAERWQAVAERAREMAAAGRAVLVGTRSVEASEQLAHVFSELGVAHTLLNARQDQDEAERIAEAGTPGRITVATNMAGRGTDIKLSSEVERNGGLHVILSEFHESARVDRQLFGRAARQGDPGSVEAIVSLDDEFFNSAATLKKCLAPYCLGQGFWPRFLFRLLVFYTQAKAERQNRRLRIETIGRDRQWLRALGFVGRG